MSQTRRIELGNILKSILGNTNTYFQPPENTKLKYPCCIYELSGYDEKRANNKLYGYVKRYQVTFISDNVDNDYYERIMSTIPMCKFDRRFIVDNLYHDVFSIYY